MQLSGLSITGLPAERLPLGFQPKMSRDWRRRSPGRVKAESTSWPRPANSRVGDRNRDRSRVLGHLFPVIQDLIFNLNF
jgi:hypothetical protein